MMDIVLVGEHEMSRPLVTGSRERARQKEDRVELVSWMVKSSQAGSSELWVSDRTLNWIRSEICST